MPTQITVSNRVIDLINESAAKVGNPSKLGPTIGYTRHDVSAWIHGGRPCPVEAQALMAAVAGRNIDDVIREALIERNANTPRGEKLVSALGKGLMSAGGLTAITLYGSDASASSAIVLVDLLRCIFRAFL